MIRSMPSFRHDLRSMHGVNGLGRPDDRMCQRIHLFVRLRHPCVYLGALGGSKEAVLRELDPRARLGRGLVLPGLEGAGHLLDPLTVRDRSATDASFDSESRLARFRLLWHQRVADDAAIQTELDVEAGVLRQRSLELSTIVETELRELRRLGVST
jgi:hypothetical protein